MPRVTINRRTLIAGVVAAATVSLLFPPTAAAATSTTGVECRVAAPIYRNVPVFGDRLGDLSEFEYSSCRPTDDTVRLVSRRPVADNLGQPWVRVVVDGPVYGPRPGWVPLDDLIVRPCPPDRGGR